MKSVSSILILVLSLTSGGLWAQSPNPKGKAQREQISAALSKGNAAAAQKLMSEATSAVGEPSVGYEEIKACGFHPQSTRIECIVDVKLPLGYGGPVGSFGSFEFIQVCVDWNRDGMFSADESVGQGIVHVHDESAQADPPWQYAIYLDINPPGGPRTSNSGSNTTTASNGLTLKAQAVLSWAVAPTDCNFRPVWGNTVPFSIRMDPVR